ncbi:SHS2 domain-containing protein [Lipingzhangella halophila]|uniref:SHS2 domain-containing protein n=1 Tax=Lipingzhangella halophila TaxID=1783352 RepID=A0A7W7REE6_9ACTN|nr:archease [Lipingzhangella halophila]MBB4930472.1 SHS2 domain-containing protein [Lipingzhangella halophila]
MTTVSGHRALPHTSDIRIEAWAPTREECMAEAVRGLVASFAAPPPAAPSDAYWTVPTGGETDEDALVAVLDEVIYVLETEGGVPARVEAAHGRGGPLLLFRLAPLHEATLTGAAPKAVTLHDLRFGPTGDGWSCEVTVDV